MTLQKAGIVVIFFLAFLLLPTAAEATAFTQAFVRIDRMKASQATGGQVCAKTGTTGTESSVTVTFPGNGTQGTTSFGVNSTAANWTTSTSNIPGDASPWPTISATASNVTGAAVTFTGGDLTPATLYCFNFTSTTTLTNPTQAGDSLAGTLATNIDSSQIAFSIISEDQVVVTATVPAIFTFAIPDTSTLALGVLSTSTVSTSAGRAINLSTNAAAGWVAWVMSDNGALNSTTTGTGISSPGTVNNTPDSLAGQAGYVLGVAITTDGAGTGTVSQAANYGAEYANSANTGGHLTQDVYTPIAASSGTTDGDVLTFYAKAKTSALQAPATDYTDTLTFVGAGRF